MFHLKIPDKPSWSQTLATRSTLPFTYPKPGVSKGLEGIPGYDADRLRAPIGKGRADFASACLAIRQWDMFPHAWTRIMPAGAPIAPNTAVLMFARFSGFWWRNVCRIVYTIEADNRFGFAYGTLPGHIESGEELFLVEIDDEGLVWYEIRAFSRPRHWLAKVFYPLMRLLQARFRNDSLVQMEKSCKHASKC